MKILGNNKGFTMIEIIVVIAIIGILGAIAIPKYGNFQENARQKADMATCEIIQKAVLMAITEGELVVKDNISITIIPGDLDKLSANIKATLGKYLYFDDLAIQQKNKSKFIVSIENKDTVKVEIHE